MKKDGDYNLSAEGDRITVSGRESAGQWTKGPWRFEDTASRFNWLRGANGETIFHADPHDNNIPSEQDARLISLAPEMAEALRAFADAVKQGTSEAEMLRLEDAARAILSRIES